MNLLFFKFNSTILAGHDGLELYRGDEMTSPAPFRDANIFAFPLA